MSIGSKIAYYRKRLNITQDALAQQLEVTNQAVSKWESDQCCPDIQLLPRPADIFGITIDELFDRAPKQQTETVCNDLPWPDDQTLHAVLYVGHTLVGSNPAAKEITFVYEGPALDIDSAFNVKCNDVAGDVNAGGNVACGDVGGDVDAGINVSCGDVGGDVDAGESVCCGDVDGDVDAGGGVSCGNIGGDVDASGKVTCGDVNGDVDAGGSVECGAVSGDVDAGGSVTIKK